jgi:hypothetical protein
MVQWNLSPSVRPSFCKFNKVAIIIIIIIAYCSVQIQGCAAVSLTEGLYGYLHSLRLMPEIKLVGMIDITFYMFSAKKF